MPAVAQDVQAGTTGLYNINRLLIIWRMIPRKYAAWKN